MSEASPNLKLGMEKARGGVSIVSLDHFSEIASIHPGEPLRIAPGITISVLKSAAEGLIEIDAQAKGDVFINGRKTSELATVQPGQIIETDAGRFVMVRHLEALIVPKKAGAARPAYLQDAINLALQSLRDAEGGNLNSHKEQSSQMAGDSLVAGSAGSWRQTMVRAAIAASVLGIVAMAIFGGSDKTINSKISRTKRSEYKSKIIPVHPEASPETATSASTGPESTSDVASDPESPQSEANVAATQEPVRPKKTLKPASDIAAREKSGSSATQKQENGSVKLSEKDRQTVYEYKLEARFDRSSAREKLKKMASTFPEGSAARAEVERAYSSL